MGSVAPLIAVWQKLKERNLQTEALFIGTSHGPEKDFLRQYPQIGWQTVPAGKLRRYFSWQTFFAPALVIAGIIKAFFILKKFQPQIIVAAGSFVAVPVILASKLLGVKILIHQLDLKPSLSNKLVQSLADKITVTFKQSLINFPSKKTVMVGSLIRQEAGSVLPKPQLASKTLLILGGGTGALALNQLIAKTIPQLPANLLIYHMTGRDKTVKVEKNCPNYHPQQFFANDYYQKINQADLVITRAGLSTLLELAYFKKAAIIIALPKSQQQKNADYFSQTGGAVCLDQNQLTPLALKQIIMELLNNPKKLKKLGEKIDNLTVNGGEILMAKEIEDLVQVF